MKMKIVIIIGGNLEKHYRNINIWNLSKKWNKSENSIIRINKNTKESSGVLKKLAATWSLVKTSKEKKLDYY